MVVLSVSVVMQSHGWFSFFANCRSMFPFACLLFITATVGRLCPLLTHDACLYDRWGALEIPFWEQKGTPCFAEHRLMFDKIVAFAVPSFARFQNYPLHPVTEKTCVLSFLVQTVDEPTVCL